MSDVTRDPDPSADALLHRHLTGVAYRLLGSLAEAEDAVQEGYARWYALSAAQRAAVAAPAAWLTTAVSRVCLDVLKSARVRRERYVGPWLPEPVSDESVSGATADPVDRVSLDESVSMAVLAVLERLTPAERVSFVLHDVFGYPYAELAAITGRSPGACRQLAFSARRQVRADRRMTVSRGDLRRAVAAFKIAWETGDVAALVGQLTSAAVATIDGGGKVSAAQAPLVGAECVAEFFAGVYERQPDLVLREALVNGYPGLIAGDGTGTVLATVSADLDGPRISTLWVVRNPEKLASWSGGASERALT